MTNIFTIKDLADKIGVSKQAIRYKIDSIGVLYDKDSTGTIILTEKEANKVFGSYGINLDEPKISKEYREDALVEAEILRYKLINAEKRIKELETLSTNLTNELRDVKTMIKTKDDQLINVTNQLATLADQAQKLQLRQLEAPKAGFWARFFKS